MYSTALDSGINKRIRKRNAALLGGLLVEARQKAGMNQTTLADRLGKKQSFVSKYESGERSLDLTEIIRISRELGAEPAELVKQLEEKGVGFPRVAPIR